MPMSLFEHAHSNRMSIKRVVVGSFFILLLIVGFSSYRDYGVSWDEQKQRLTGGVTVKYLGETLAPILLTQKVKSYPSLENYRDIDRYYGVAFEAPAVVLEQALNITDDRDVFMYRHLVTFLVFCTGVFAVYRLAARRFGDWRIGLLTAAFLVLSPRLFADAFYNSKDLVLMATFAIATNTFIQFVTKPDIKTALLNGLATAFAIDVRITAVVLPAATIATFIIKLAKNQVSASEGLPLLFIFLGVTCIFVVAMWPWLWSDPFGNFLQAFKSMSQFKWGHNEVLYLGEFISATELPWHYSLVWISITTPLLYLGLFTIGFVWTVRLVISNRFRLWSNEVEMQDMLFLGLVLVPILSVIVLHSVLYDGWRHLYFVYPAMLLVATKGWVILWNARGRTTLNRVALGIITLISAGHTASWMWNTHPFQNVYFNALAGDGVRNRFEMDYWGLGNRKALEYILDHDQSPLINVWADSFTRIENSFVLLRPEDRSRLRRSDDKSNPLYVLTNYRGVKEKDDSKYSRNYELFYQLKIGKEVILSVYRWLDSTIAPNDLDTGQPRCQPCSASGVP
jgi:hypothetical protein